MVRAYLFDFDGTLADSYAAITASVNHVRQIRQQAALSEAEVRQKVGFGLPRLMADLLPDSDPDENAALYRQHHPTVMFSHTRLLPTVAETLQALHTLGSRLAICSNKPSAITRQLVQSLQLTHLFDAVLGPEDSGIPKPDPAMLLLAMERLQATPEETIYIGDMTIDIETARNANLPVWVVPTGSHDRETLQQAKPDRILNEMRDILEAKR